MVILWFTVQVTSTWHLAGIIFHQVDLDFPYDVNVKICISICTYSIAYSNQPTVNVNCQCRSTGARPTIVHLQLGWLWLATDISRRLSVSSWSDSTIVLVLSWNSSHGKGVVIFRALNLFNCFWSSQWLLTIAALHNESFHESVSGGSAWQEQKWTRKSLSQPNIASASPFPGSAIPTVKVRLRVRVRMLKVGVRLPNPKLRDPWNRGPWE